MNILKKEQAPGPLINEKIRSDRMQLITADGRNIGVVTREEALRHARESSLDLVILTEQGPEGYPIAKVLDFGKATYEKKQQSKDAKKKQHIVQIKELKLRPKIADNDYRTKMNQAIDFLKDGKRLKVTIMFRGREAAMRDERGTELFEKIAQTLEEAGLTKFLVQEKDAKTPQMWSRVYYMKNSK